MTDHPGSVRYVIDTQSGEIKQQLDYDAFGRVLRDSSPEFQPLGFAAGVYLRGPALTRFGARDYDPHTGRWTARDPILFGGGQDNLYVYCGNDPVNCVDPSGLIDEPGFGESFIPIWGPGRQALHDIEHGNVLSAGWNSAMAASDVFLVSTVCRGLTKGAVKLGSHTWDATRKWITRKGWREFKGQHMHHWLIPRGGWGKKVPELIKNQPWNLMGMPRNLEFHRALHGTSRLIQFNMARRIWLGSPQWSKAAVFSSFGRAYMQEWSAENGCEID